MNQLNHYVILQKNKNFLLFFLFNKLAHSSFDTKDIVDFMWGKSFRNYAIYKNGKKIDFSKYSKNEYVNLNNLERLLINH